MSSNISYVDECISIILSLKHTTEYIFPSELIQIIIRLYRNLCGEPVLLLYTHINPIINAGAGAMGEMSLIGDNTLIKILEIKPYLRFCRMEATPPPVYFLVESNFKCALTSVSSKNNPKALNLDTDWLSLMQLIPVPLWDYAMLYPDSNLTNTDSIRTCNRHGNNNNMACEYDIVYPNEILRWFTDSLNHPDFMAAQNARLL